MAKKTSKKKKLATMNISMPASLRAQVDQKMRAGGFGNVSEYVRSLIRFDLRYDGVGTLERFIEEGLQSPVQPMDERWLAAGKKRLRERPGQGRRRAG